MKDAMKKVKFAVLLILGVTAGPFPASGAVSSMPVPRPPLLGPVPPVRCMKWDAFNHPVTLTATTTPEPGRWIRWCMDGYPQKASQPFPREHWRTTVPSREKPETLTVDYGSPLAVTRYVHYFDYPQPVTQPAHYFGLSKTSSAWKEVDIECSSDGKTWQPLQSFTELPGDYPQVLAIDKPVLARYYRFIIKSLADGASALATYEIETYYGTTVGTAECGKPVQSEPFELKVRVTSPDTALEGAVLKLTARSGSLAGALQTAVPSVPMRGSSVATFKLTPLVNGPAPVLIELYAGGILIDKRSYTIRVNPKLALNPTEFSAGQQSVGNALVWKASIANRGSSPARGVTVSWLGRKAALGDMQPGQSKTLVLNATAKAGYDEGQLIARDAGLARTMIRVPTVCRSAVAIAAGGSRWTLATDRMKLSVKPAGGGAALTGTLQVFASGRPCGLEAVAPGRLAADVHDGVLLVDLTTDKETGELALECRVVPDDPNPLYPWWLDLELRVAADRPKIMFNPHIDWYRAGEKPNVPDLANGHNSATRMLCIQTSDGTLSLVPDTDNMLWGFTPANEMTMKFQIPLAPRDPPGEAIWKPINESPSHFRLLLPVRKGDWWDAYRHVVQDIFHFHQPRQWAMPVTQMQMQTSRYMLRYEVWSNRFQTVTSFPYNDTVYFNFYGTTYTVPALYSWFLATDNLESRIKAEKVVDWLLNVRQKDGPLAGAWFSQYHPEGDPAQLVGRDQAGNRWIMPHATGTAAKTLLWYWEASGRKDQRVLDAAKSGCDLLIGIQRPDGGWPYAFDLEGKAITDLADAGQIWCTWVLWRMHGITGDEKYRAAAIKSKDFFKRTFVDVHRYMGYWEDVSGGAGNVTRSWEGYEPAIGALVFTEMGDRKLALDCAKDAAVWSWTRVTSTRQYETAYGETTEQSAMGPAQAQAPMIGVGLHQVYQNTGDPIWSDFAGAMKAINFCADPDQGYGMTATTGWFDPTTGVAGPPYDNVRPWITAGNMRGDEYGRGVWAEWQTSQFAWLALEWLIREGNLRAPGYVKIDPDTLRGSVLDEPGRIKMPEERCDVNGVGHYDINWVGYQNDSRYALLIMNHGGATAVAIRPHEAHLEVYTRVPRILIGGGKTFHSAKVAKRGVQYMVDVPANGNALLVWDRIK